MAKSKFEYVKSFEQSDVALLNTWIVLRLDGRGFHKFSEAHKYQKPNDERGLMLMNKCASSVMEEFHDIVLAYGESDEYSFVMRRSSTLFQRRASKLISSVVSYFSSCFVFHWKQFFVDHPLLYPPTFDCRLVCYPSVQNIRDYLSWRQADCHINNLYNTCFWSLVQSGMSAFDAEKRLMGTSAGEKNEILYSNFNMNYNNINPMFRKGSVLIKGQETVEHTKTINRHGTDEQVTYTRKQIIIQCLHEDIIGDAFWENNPQILAE